MRNPLLLMVPARRSPMTNYLMPGPTTEAKRHDPTGEQARAFLMGNRLSAPAQARREG